MQHTSALIEKNRASMRQAIDRGDMEQAGFYCRIVVSMQDFPVKLRPVASILAEEAARDAIWKARKDKSQKQKGLSSTA
jgi:hypothetical protein